MSEINDEIRERAREEARALLDAVLFDRPAPEPIRRTPVKPVGNSPLAGKPRPDKYDRQGIKKMFERGLTVKQISEQTGAYRGTVSKILTEVGVPLSSRRGPYTRLDRCKRDHDMNVHGRPNSGNRGGRYCSECRRQRQRKEEAV